MNRNDLSGKVAIVTGGAKNLGGAVSVELAKLGANVVLHYHSDAAKADAQATQKAIEALGSEAHIFQADLSKPTNMKALFDFAVAQFGGVDIAVNTVGMILRSPIINTNEADYDKMFAVNTKTAFFFMQQAGERLWDNGKIITITTSILAAFTPNYGLYGGAKAPVEHFTRAAAKEFAGRGISVTSVAPGPMDTPFFYGEETQARVDYLKSQAMGNQLTQVEDIVPIVRFLVTEGWWITGQTIFANGGFATR